MRIERRRKARELEELIAPFRILVEPFLQYGTEIIPDRLERLGFVSAVLISSWRMRLVTPFLIAAKTGLAWIISRETLSGRSAEIDDKASKTQPARQKIAILSDQDTADVEAARPLRVGSKRSSGREAGMKARTV